MLATCLQNGRDHRLRSQSFGKQLSIPSLAPVLLRRENKGSGHVIQNNIYLSLIEFATAIQVSRLRIRTTCARTRTSLQSLVAGRP